MVEQLDTYIESSKADLVRGGAAAGHLCGVSAACACMWEGGREGRGIEGRLLRLRGSALCGVSAVSRAAARR